VAFDRSFYLNLTESGIAGDAPDADTCVQLLQSPEIELLPLLDAAFQVRRHFHGHEVAVHILNNAQNGHCPEDCHYCAQARTSKADIEPYGLKSDDEVLEEARVAYESGAYRYCMVFAGRGPSKQRLERLARQVRKIKQNYPLQICVSPGLMDDEGTSILKDAGVDRLNHNLNTSERHYPKICTTHTYADRVRTLEAAKRSGLQMCSGIIVGMGEADEDVVDVARTLRSLEASSIPVNFLVPIPGNQLEQPARLSPTYCLRVLCMYRFVNPQAELRAAAGREGHLRSMEVMALYPANSLFLDGYLNTRGGSRERVLQMIKDAGFEIKSPFSVDEMLDQEAQHASFQVDPGDGQGSILKTLEELRPANQASDIATADQSSATSPSDRK
jgi:biotin synthase